jgi:hypothetical protein
MPITVSNLPEITTLPAPTITAWNEAVKAGGDGEITSIIVPWRTRLRWEGYYDVCLCPICSRATTQGTTIYRAHHAEWGGQHLRTA